MAYIFAVFVGTVIGVVAGYTVVWVFDGVFVSRFSQVVIGILSGGVFGGLIGSLIGDSNASGAARHQFVVAAFFGIAGGIAGATKLVIAKEILNAIGFQLPT